MRLNAYLARAGVASRRKADELIKAGRVRVNGEPGELNTFVGEPPTRSRSTGSRSAKQRLAYLLLHKPRRRRDDRARPAGPPDRRRARPRRAAGRPGRPTRCRHDRRAPAHERRPARPPARASRATRSTRSTSPRSRATPARETLRRLEEGIELDDGRTAPAQARRLAPVADRADAPRGPQAPGEADVRGRRPPGAPPAPQPLRGPRRSAASPRSVARAHPRRGRGAPGLVGYS